MITCIGCGCDDDHACEGGCAWHFISAVHPDLGICSQCAWNFNGHDHEHLTAQAAADWLAQSQDLTPDRATRELITPDDPEFYEALRGY